jgi:Holliday junction resolvase RuvA-like protein
MSTASTTSCARIGTIESEDDWVTAHAALSRLARQRAAADAEEGRWLLRAWRASAHRHLGFGSFGEYVERLFGHAPRSTKEKLRVAEALEVLPALASALAAGTLSWSAVRELTRVALPQTEGAWLDAARGKTVRQLEELVADKRPGDHPSASPTPTPRRRILRFDVAPETFALFRDAMRELRRRAGAALDDDSALLALARQVLGGPEDSGRANYQIALSVCPACGSACQQGGGELVPVGAHILAMAHCDGQHLGSLDVPANQNASSDANSQHQHQHQHAVNTDADPRSDDRTTRDVATVPDAHVGTTNQAHASQASSHTASLHAPVHTERAQGNVSIHAIAHVGTNQTHASQAPCHTASIHGPIHTDGVPDEPVNHGRDDIAHTPDAAAHAPNAQVEPARVHTRATQTIPPALRRAVLLRDHGCCRVPGCKNTLYLDLHHIQLRSEGGRHELQNILSICGVHHRALHRGELSIQGTATNPSFRHADGNEYGQVDRPRALDTHAKVFSALRGLGFREAQARAALAELQKQSAPREVSPEQLLRAALQLLTRPCASARG